MSHPVWNAAAISAAIAAVIALLVAFGVKVTQEQTVAILGVVAAVMPFVAAAMSNSKVTPLANPRDETGEELVRKSDQQPTRAAREAHLRSIRRGAH